MTAAVAHENIMYLGHQMNFSTTIVLVLTTVLFTTHTMAQTRQTLQFLALGDSYTIGESVQENQRWPVQVAARLREKGMPIADPKIIATTGWRTDDLKRAIISENIQPQYDLVSLLIGVNNQYQGRSAASYAPEFDDLLQIAIDLAGGNTRNVFVVSIPDYGYTPFGKEKQETISREIDEFNRVNREIAQRKGVMYFNITDISRRGLEEPDLIAEDRLHPSGRMYKLWADLIAAGISNDK